MNLSFADSAIAFYGRQVHVSALAAGDLDSPRRHDGNPLTVAPDLATPLGHHAADPSYPGAHSTISAAGAEVLRQFLR